MLRDAPTPTSAQLDKLADVTPADEERAARKFTSAVRKGPRRALATLLQADTAAATGPAEGPLPDA